MLLAIFSQMICHPAIIVNDMLSKPSVQYALHFADGLASEATLFLEFIYIFYVIGVLFEMLVEMGIACLDHEFFFKGKVIKDIVAQKIYSVGNKSAIRRVRVIQHLCNPGDQLLMLNVDNIIPCNKFISPFDPSFAHTASEFSVLIDLFTRHAAREPTCAAP